MVSFIEKKRPNLFYKIISSFVSFTLVFSSVIPPASVSAQATPTVINLPAPGVMLAPSNAFFPVLIKGIEIHPKNPLMFDFIMDTGDTSLTDEQFRQESSKLVKYFLAALTVPEEEMWVNLSPYEENRIIPKSFGQTEAGRDLLVQDYILKQLVASLTYPEDELGQKFWNRVYKQAEAKYGRVDIPMNTFNKIWILPEKASVYEYDKGAFVVDSRLKVMLEEDYLALEMNQNSTKHALGNITKDDLDVVTGIEAEAVREILIPEIEREVNEGEHFANLRQIYNAMILATWYKQRLKNSLLGQVYADQKKVSGLQSENLTNQEIYDRYVRAFQKGVYDYIKEDYDETTQEVIPRKYFSGGATAQDLGKVLTTSSGNKLQAGSVNLRGKAERVTTEISPESSTPSASSPVAAMARVVSDPSILKWTTARFRESTTNVPPQTLEEVLTQIIKEYDIRGYDGFGDKKTNPQQYDEELLQWIGRAMATVEFGSAVHRGRKVRLNPGDSFVIAGDNGPSTQWVKDNLIKGLREAGINVIDLGGSKEGEKTVISGQLYKSIRSLGAQGGLYVTRSHVEIGTNGMKPNVGGITLYGDMLKALQVQILKAEYLKANTKGSLDISTETRELSRRKYYDSLRAEYSGLREAIEASGIKVALNFNGGASVDYRDIAEELIGRGNITRIIRDTSDPFNENGGLADPSRDDDVALAHPKENVIQYSKEHPNEFIINFDLDTDRVSIVLGGELYLGDRMLYPIVEYLLTLDRYKDIHKTQPFWVDSRMRKEVQLLVGFFGGIAKKHPKGHSKVKATMDMQLLELAESKGYSDIQSFLDDYPGYKDVQAEYSLHMFKTDSKGQAFDDALDFGLYWLQVYTSLIARHREAGNQWAESGLLNDYIDHLVGQGAFQISVQLKEQRTLSTDAAKTKVMFAMKDAVVGHFSGRPDFVYEDNWRTAAGGKPFILVDIDGVFDLTTPRGNIFWGWSNTAAKVAYGVQSDTNEDTVALAEAITALYIHSRKQVDPNLSPIDDQETKALRNLLGEESSAAVEARVLAKYPTMEDALDGLAGVPPARSTSSPLTPSASSPVAAVLPRVKPTETKSWLELKRLVGDRGRYDLRELFAVDDNRSKKLSLALNDGFEVDFSKNLIDGETLEILLKLAEETSLKEAIEQMFTGKKINETENRAVLHTALRNVRRGKEGELVAANGPVFVDGKDVMPEVIAVLNKMEKFTKQVRSGEWKGASGKRIKHVVSIGIGGSDLGPKMAAEALKPFGRDSGIEVHFISNIDGTAVKETLRGLDPEETLVIVESKTFTTGETIQNARTVKKWVSNYYTSNPSLNVSTADAIKKHFVAVSMAKGEVEGFGIDLENMFPFWDWVGGRYSVWSAIGLPLATYVGFDNFLAMLEGAREVDEHFRTQPFDKNIPVLKALLGIWYSNFLGAATSAILPYDQYLGLFPKFAQQFFMESNGKSTDRDGNRIIDYQTGQIIWGEAGTDGQHSFYQLIHQGTRLVPADFIGITRSQNPLEGHHDKFYSDFIAQPFALAFGAKLAEVKAELVKKGSVNDEDLDWHAAHRTFEGNKPTTSILIDEMDPKVLGSLIAIYEHQIMAEGVILNIFSFDQWGVELGKKVATDRVLPYLDGSKPSEGLVAVERGKVLQGPVDRFNKRKHGATPAADPLGGIDLNASALDLKTANVGKFSFPVPTPQMIQNMNQATGFVPIIIQVTPIVNLPLILGFANENEKHSNELTFNLSGLDPIVGRERFKARELAEISL